MNLNQISDLEFPNTPMEIAKNKDVRVAVVKASAYVTLALEEAGISHSRSQEGAAVTDATHNLKENKTPEEYIELAIQELAYAETEVSDNRYQSQLSEIRSKLQSL